MAMTVLDLFSAAAGGWSLGLHRAGFKTVAACEVMEWRRILYSENNPDVRLYDDVCTLTAEQLLADLGALPDCIVGSPPCQDISSANTKGKGVDGARSGLFFEAVRIIGECRPRWFALENSAHLRTKGADRVLARLESLGYATEPCVVGADNAGANHERKRAWLIGFDPDQILQSPFRSLLSRPRAEHEGGDAAHSDGHGWSSRRRGRGLGVDLSLSDDPQHAESIGHEGGRSWGRGPDGVGSPSVARGLVGVARNPDEQGLAFGEGEPSDDVAQQPAAERATGGGQDDACHPARNRRRRGRARRRAEPSAGLPVKACGDGSHTHDQGQSDSAEHDEVGGGPGPGGDASGPRPEWNGGLAGHLRLDDGLSAWVAGTRVAVGGPKGTAAASLLVEAFGDAVLPQIPEAIGRAILRTEAALAAVLASQARAVA